MCVIIFQSHLWMKRMSHIISYSLLWFLCFIYLNSLCCRTLPRRWCCEAGWSPIPKSKSRQIGSLQQQHLGNCVWPSPTLKWVSCSVQAIQLHGSYPVFYAITSLMQSQASCNHEPHAITSLMQSQASCNHEPHAITSLMQSCNHGPHAITSLMQSQVSCNHKSHAITSLMQSQASCNHEQYKVQCSTK